MIIFTYKGRNRIGNIIDGERVARTPQELAAALEREQIEVISIKRKPMELKIPFLKGREKVKLRDLSVFNRQFSVMFNAGLPITQTLQILSEQQQNKFFKSVLESVRKDVEGGSNLSNALKKHPKVFNELYTSMIQAGEASGNLDTILMRLSEYIENMNKLMGKVKSALAYPISVLGIALLLTYVILTKVVPVFATLFEGLGATLPLPTILVVNMSNFMIANIGYLFIGGIGLVFLMRAYNKTYKGKRVFDKIKLKIWIIGTLLTKTAVARVTRTLETLLNSGVEIIESMTITAKTSGNAIIEDSVMRSRAAVQEGRSLGESWEEQKMFPFMVTQMVMVGEQTGSLSTMLGKVADFYDEEVDQAVSALLSLIEPLMIVVLGLLIGGVVIAMYLPMFDLISKV
jgi:type IV pilus assembly protein PilC